MTILSVLDPIPTTMTLYSLYIKSHADAPDYEAETEAETKAEAAQLFWERLSWEGRADCSPKDLLGFISEA